MLAGGGLYHDDGVRSFGRAAEPSTKSKEEVKEKEMEREEAVEQDGFPGRRFVTQLDAKPGPFGPRLDDSEEDEEEGLGEEAGWRGKEEEDMVENMVERAE